MVDWFIDNKGGLYHQSYKSDVCELTKADYFMNKMDEVIQWFASKQAGAQDVFFIGRGLDYAVSMEGSLKLKEISYIHSEAYAAGELKLGSISLIEDGTLCVAIATQPAIYEKTISNVVEVKSRGGYIFGITNKEHVDIEDTADFVVYVPVCNPLFAASLAVIPLQLVWLLCCGCKGL